MDIESFTFDMTTINDGIANVERSLKRATVPSHRRVGELALELFKLKIFIMKRAASGINSVKLVPSLRNKITNLYGQYLECLQEALDLGFINEGIYLNCCNETKDQHESIIQVLDVLELGLVVKCEII